MPWRCCDRGPNKTERLSLQSAVVHFLGCRVGNGRQGVFAGGRGRRGSWGRQTGAVCGKDQARWGTARVQDGFRSGRRIKDKKMVAPWVRAETTIDANMSPRAAVGCDRSPPPHHTRSDSRRDASRRTVALIYTAATSGRRRRRITGSQSAGAGTGTGTGAAAAAPAGAG